MSEHIDYKGKSLGTLRLDDTNTGKTVFVAESLECLAELFRIPPKDEIGCEFLGKMPYEQFVERYLKKVSGFYPNMDSWLLKNEMARAIDKMGKPRR